MKLKRLLPEHTGWELRGKQHPILNFFKNFFIPHEGNCYEPHFLRPKRLFWYGVSSLSLKLVVLVFISFLPLSAWMTPDIMAEQASKIVSLTNDLRANQGLVALAPNARLAEAAKGKTEDMLSGQYFAHANSEGYTMKYWLKSAGYNYLVAGENLAVGFGDAVGTVNAWQASPSHYQNLVGDFSETGVAVVIGEYKGKEVALATQYVALPMTIAARKPEVPIVQAPAVDEVVRGTADEAIAGSVAVVPDKAVLSEKVNPAPVDVASIPAKPVVKVPAIAKASGQNKVIVAKNTENKPADSMVVAVAPAEVKPAGGVPVVTAQVMANPGELAPLEPVVLQPSALEKYFLVKSHAVPATKWLFGVSSQFYKLLLLFVGLALVLSIVIKFRVQNYRLIASASAFLVVLSVLVII